MAGASCRASLTLPASLSLVLLPLLPCASLRPKMGNELCNENCFIFPTHTLKHTHILTGITHMKRALGWAIEILKDCAIYRGAFIFLRSVQEKWLFNLWKVFVETARLKRERLLIPPCSIGLPQYLQFVWNSHLSTHRHSDAGGKGKWLQTHFGCSCALPHTHLCLEVDMLHLHSPLQLFPLHPFTLPHPGILVLPVRRLSWGQAQRLKDFPLAAALLLSLCALPSTLPCPALPSSPSLSSPLHLLVCVLQIFAYEARLGHFSSSYSFIFVSVSVSALPSFYYYYFAFAFGVRVLQSANARFLSTTLKGRQQIAK